MIRVAITTFLEGLDADALHDVDEALGVAVALLEVALDQALDHVGDVGARERRPDDLAEGCAERRGLARRPLPHLSLVAADLDLVPLLAVLVDAEDADVADVVVAAGVHAARDVEVELADIVLVVEILEAPLQRLVPRTRKARLDTLDLVLGQRRRAVLEVRPLGLDLLAEFVDAALLDQDLDARLVDVVAPAEAVIDAQDGVEVGKQVLPRQELSDRLSNHGSPPKATTDKDLEANFVFFIFQHMEPDIMY